MAVARYHAGPNTMQPKNAMSLVIKNWWPATRRLDAGSRKFCAKPKVRQFPGIG